MTTALLALSAGLAALLLAVAGERARRVAEARLSRAILRVGERMDALTRELEHAFDQLRSDVRRAQTALDLGTAPTVDELLLKLAEAAAAVTGADAGIAVLSAGGERAAGAAGLEEGVVVDQLFVGPPDGAPARALEISYVYRAGVQRPDGIRSALVVPLGVEERPLGLVGAYARTGPLARDALAELEHLAGQAVPAIDGAVRRAARQERRDDSLTGLHARAWFLDELARAAAASAHGAEPLILLVVDVDDFAEINAAIGHLGGDGILAGLGRVVEACARPQDAVFRMGADEFAVLMPASRTIEAEALFAQIQATVERELRHGLRRLTLSGGIAQYGRGDDSLSLLERAKAGLAAAKAAGKRTAVFERGDGTRPTADEGVGETT